MLEVQDLAVNYRGSRPQQRELPVRSRTESACSPQRHGEKHDGESDAGIDPGLSGFGEISGAIVEGTVVAGGLCPQRSQIDWDYPITVWNAVMMARTVQTGWFRSPSKQSQELVTSCFAAGGNEGLRDRQIGELSGGQQQRIFLARSIAQQADLFFFDRAF